MRTVIAGICLLTASVAAQTLSGRITADETWSGTVTVTGDVVVRNATLTISPGTVVRFDTTSDNQVNGGPAGICLIIQSGGAIHAAGTAAQPILFTTLSPVKNYGRWSQLDIMEGINTAQTVFRHCTFECCATGIDFRSSNHDAIEAVSAISIEDCTFRTISGSGIYITSGGSPTITRCRFDNCRSTAIFGHGAGTVTIGYCTISDVSVGIINAGEPTWGWEQTMHMDHLTIYNVRGEKATVAKWWTGMGIWCSGAATQTGTLTLTNSIITDVFWQGTYTSGLMVGAWDVTNDYNCWYEAGSVEVNGGDIGAHGIEADPRFAVASDPAQGLAAGSPCLDAADDGTHIGAWQGIPVSSIGMPDGAAEGTGVRAVSPVRDRGAFVFEAPAEGPVRLDIMTVTGGTVTTVTAAAGARCITWDGSGARPGVYVYRVITGGMAYRGTIIKE